MVYIKNSKIDIDFKNILLYLCDMNNSLIGRKVSIKFPTSRFSWEVADCKINKETEKAVHIVRTQMKGVIRDTTISRWVPKSMLQDKGDYLFIKMSF